MNTKHTPGPWAVVDRNGYGTHFDIEGHPSYQFGGQYLVAQVDNWLTTPWVTEANARLIAAAPDGYALAKLVADLCWASEDETHGNDNWALPAADRQRLLGAAREYFAKLKGQ